MKCFMFALCLFLSGCSHTPTGHPTGHSPPVVEVKAGEGKPVDGRHTKPDQTTTTIKSEPTRTESVSSSLDLFHKHWRDVIQIIVILMVMACWRKKIGEYLKSVIKSVEATV